MVSAIQHHDFMQKIHAASSEFFNVLESLIVKEALLKGFIKIFCSTSEPALSSEGGNGETGDTESLPQ